LFHRIKRRDATAFELLFRTYHGRLCSFAYSYVKSDEAAKEIVQTLFQKMWESGGELQIKTSVKAYLYQSVRNLSLDYLKHERIKQSYEEEALREPVSQRNLDEILHEKDLLSVVEQSIDKLPERCRQIFRMHWKKGSPTGRSLKFWTFR